VPLLAVSTLTLEIVADMDVLSFPVEAKLLSANQPVTEVIIGNLSGDLVPGTAIAARENWRGTLAETNLPNHWQPRAS